MTLSNKEYAVKVYTECVEAVKDFLGGFVNGDMSVINSPAAGLCINLPEHLPYQNVSSAFSSGLVGDLSRSWVSKYNSGSKEFPVLGGQWFYQRHAGDREDLFYVGEQLDARLDLAKHLLKHCDNYFKRERDNIVWELIYRIENTPHPPTLKRSS